MTRTRYLPILLAAICIALGSSLVGVAAPPNVVMILSDDQAWNDYGFMGHETIETPHLDRLASESLTFRRGYVPTSLCRPSLATIITGLYPHQHGVVGNDPPRPVIEGQPKRRIPSFDPRYVPIRRQFLKHVDAMTTLPDLLSPLGYRSMQTGKWWEGKYDRGGFTDGMTIGNRAKGGRHGDAGLVIGRKGFSVVDEFLDSARKENTPFFLWYAPFLPHTPHTPPKRLLDKYSKRTDSLPMAKYYAMVEWFDETCGDLMKRIDERGMRDNTIVIYVTDNGWINRKDSSRYAPRSKRSPNEGGLRTPIMIRWPNHVSPEMNATDLASSIDLVPTVLSALGQPVPEGLPGINLLDSDAVSKRNQLFGEIFEHDIVDMDDAIQSLQYRWTIRGKWKLIQPSQRMSDRSPQLYNVSADPHENQNLAEEQPEMVLQLQRELNAWWPVSR